MSGGGIGNGLSYWASIKISGDLTQQELEQVKKNIEAALKAKVGGKDPKGTIELEARVSDKNSYPSFDTAYHK
jgi:hypothetical protein